MNYAQTLKESLTYLLKKKDEREIKILFLHELPKNYTRKEAEAEYRAFQSVAEYLVIDSIPASTYLEAWLWPIVKDANKDIK